MVDEAGWERPSVYTSVDSEIAAVQSNGGICDISPVGKFSAQGEDLSFFLQSALPEAASLPVHGVNICNLPVTNETAPVKVVVHRFANDEAFLTCSPSSVDQVANTLNEHLSGCVHMVDKTSNFAAITLVGPESSQLLSKLTDLDISPRAFPNLSCAQGMVAEVYVIVARKDLDDILSYKLYVGRDLGSYMWEAMLEAGHELNVVPVGVEALNRLSGEG